MLELNPPSSTYGLPREGTVTPRIPAIPNQPGGTPNRGVHPRTYVVLTSFFLDSFCIYACTSLIANIFDLAPQTHTTPASPALTIVKQRSNTLFIRAARPDHSTVHLYFHLSFDKLPNSYFLRKGHQRPLHTETLFGSEQHQTLHQVTRSTKYRHTKELQCATTLKSSSAAATSGIPSELGVPIMRRHIGVVHRR